ncbi:MAG: hypothetical protein ACI9Y7_000588 [Dokdonia sp.]|jgi:hypothetical protein
MKKQGKAIELKKMTISKIQTDDLKTIRGGELPTSVEPLRDYLISMILACVG